MKINYKCIIVFILLITSCQEKNKKTKMQNKSTNKNYNLVYRFSVPYEVFINNTIREIDLKGELPGPTEINEYILNNGIQRVKVKVFHPFIEKGGLLKKKDFVFLNKNLSIQNVIEEGSDIKVNLVKKLDFPEIEQPVPFIEYEWEFEAALPFELEGWKNSENLENWDTEVLEKKVLDKFTELRELLNTGNGADFVKELDFANKEFFIANYFSEKQKQEYTANLIATYSEHKDIMPVIENYRVRIMGDGKVVTLENLGKYKGQSVLTAENKEKDVLYLNYVMLHKPKNSDDFKIVRINSQMTSID